MGIIGQKVKKNIKTLKNLIKLERIEGFEHEKPYHTPPEYPGYDAKIPPQHRVSDPHKNQICATANAKTRRKVNTSFGVPLNEGLV